MPKLLVIHGAGMNMRGKVQTEIFGTMTLPEYDAHIRAYAAELGVVDYGHRATPDVYLNAALSTKGIWNSSQFFNADFDAAFKEFQAAVGVDAQKAACTKMQTILNEDVPIGLPYFYNYLGGTSKEFTGTYSSALGQMFFQQTTKAG